MNGKSKGDYVLIPCLPVIPTDVPLELKRLQFPVRLAFSMTINKVPGQSLQVCRLNLEYPWFAYGQLIICLHVREWKIAQKQKNIVCAIALQ